MSSSKQGAVVSREYKSSPNECARALELLLMKSVRKKGGSATAPDDAKESRHGVATANVTR